jgi:preprotein translocase subunit Sec61beta
VRIFKSAAAEKIVMAQDKVSAPQSSAGLVRFYDVTSSKVQITPELVVGFSIAVIAIEMVVGRLLQ